jgi:hypothetical protein
VYNYALWFDRREAAARKNKARLDRLLGVTLFFFAVTLFLLAVTSFLCLDLYFAERGYVYIRFASFIAVAMTGVGLYCYRYFKSRG